jgi:RND family efflux transporter MFP subunit
MRKLEDLERLCEAGAVSVEALKSARHTQSCLEEELSLLDLSLAEGAIGIRMCDLAAAGSMIEGDSPSLSVIGDEGPPSPALFKALVALHSRSLQSEMTAAEALVEAALLDLEGAERALRELELRAPFDGRLLSCFVKEGSLLPAGKALVSVMDGSAWDVIVQIGEQYAADLSGGLPVACTIPAVNLHLEGRLDLVAGKADRTSASLPVRIRLEGDAPALRPGLYADISLALPAALEQEVLPRSSVRSKQGDTGSCFELIGSQVYERQLRLGKERNGYIAILSGLREEALVVRAPAPDLKGGDHVDSIH